MKHILNIVTVALVPIMLMNCGSTTVDNPVSAFRQGEPVETKAPNTDYTPAFPGQTRASGVITKTAINAEVISKNLSRPWGITHLPDGKLLITEKSGSMKLFTTAGELLNKVTGFPTVVDKGQGGMLDVVIDPDFENNRMIYWSFSEPYQNGNLTAVAKGRLADDEKSIEYPEVIFRAVPSYNGKLHFGSRLAFDRQGYLFVSTGERSDLETRPQAQYLNSGLGKILKITKDGEPAPGNPFAGQPDVMPEIYSYGHRNVQGLAFDNAGNLWSSEFGPKGGDEINLITSGKNYGWPIINYGLEYSGKKVGEGITQKEGMEQPVYYWDPVVSPSGITFYNGQEIPEWENNLFVACLSGQHIVRLVIENDKVIGEERLLTGEGERFRDVHQGKDGDLYAITDSGKLYKISKAE